MYYSLEEGIGILNKNNLWYEGDTSTIFKDGNLLYKIYKKKEPFKRHVLDILIANENLRDIGVLPISKLITNKNQLGMIMRYIPHSVTFRKYLQYYDVTVDNFIDILITLSDNLKKINAENIHFSDLHHNNILIQENGMPLYIDFDDAVVRNYNSTHICCIAHTLHDVSNKSYQYEGDLIKYGNLDQECLFIMLLDYLLGTYVERKNLIDFKAMVTKLSNYFENDFLIAIDSLKSEGTNIIPYQYYVGDFLKDSKTREKCKSLRRNSYEYHRFSNN